MRQHFIVLLSAFYLCIFFYGNIQMYSALSQYSDDGGALETFVHVDDCR